MTTKNNSVEYKNVIKIVTDSFHCKTPKDVIFCYTDIGLYILKQMKKEFEQRNNKEELVTKMRKVMIDQIPELQFYLSQQDI